MTCCRVYVHARLFFFYWCVCVIKIKGETSIWLHYVILYSICYRLAYVRTLINRFLSNLEWCWTRLRYAVWYHCEWPSLEVTDLRKRWNRAIVLLQTFMKLPKRWLWLHHYVGKMTGNNPGIIENMNHLSICSSCDNTCLRSYNPKMYFCVYFWNAVNLASPSNFARNSQLVHQWCTSQCSVLLFQPVNEHVGCNWARWPVKRIRKKKILFLTGPRDDLSLRRILIRLGIPFWGRLFCTTNAAMIED